MGAINIKSAITRLNVIPSHETSHNVRKLPQKKICAKNEFHAPSDNLLF